MSELVAKIRQLEADNQYDSAEYEELLGRRRDEIEAAHVRPKCCEPAGKAIRFSVNVNVDDAEDSDLVKAGRWTVGAHPVAFCPFCSRKLPEMRRKSTGKTCRVTDGGYYCAACNERLDACLCDPMDAAFGAANEEISTRSKPIKPGFYWFMPDEVGCWEPVDIDTAAGALTLRRLTRGLCLLEDAPDGQWVSASVPCADRQMEQTP